MIPYSFSVTGISCTSRKLELSTSIHSLWHPLKLPLLRCHQVGNHQKVQYLVLWCISPSFKPFGVLITNTHSIWHLMDILLPATQVAHYQQSIVFGILLHILMGGSEVSAPLPCAWGSVCSGRDCIQHKFLLSNKMADALDHVFKILLIGDAGVGKSRSTRLCFYSSQLIIIPVAIQTFLPPLFQTSCYPVSRF